MYEPMITSKKENSKTRVAIFGGSFDPPTIAHMQIACEIYNNFEHIDQVWIVPCGDGRCDIKLRTPANHRLNMLHLIKDDLIAHNVPIFIDETEINRGEYIPTYYLLKELEETHKDMEFVFCIGTDLLEGLKTWDECDKLVEEFEFATFKFDFKFAANSFLLQEAYFSINLFVTLAKFPSTFTVCK